MALCVNPDEDYVKVKMKDQDYVYYLAACAGGYRARSERPTMSLRLIRVRIWNSRSMSHFTLVRAEKRKAYYVVCDPYVTMTDGTGIVHIAPAFGEDDSKVGRKYDLPFLQLVDENGMMTKETKWAGHSCIARKDLENENGGSPEVIKDLDARGLLYSAPKFEHSYPALLAL